MKRHALWATALVLVLAGCGTEASPPADTASPEAPSEVSVLPSTTTPTIETTLHTDDAAEADADADMADEMDNHDEDMDAHEADTEHRDGESIPETTEEPTVEVDVLLTEFAFSPDPIQLAGGETVRFHLTNDGVIQHEFRLSNDHRVEEHLAAGHDDHENEGGHHEEGGDIIVLVEPGEVRVVDITLPEEFDTYTMVACLLPGHYEAGMFVPIEYE